MKWTLPLIIFLSTQSCSYLKTARKAIFDEEEPPKQKVVPKAQYDELMRKYDEANRDNITSNDTIKNNDAYANIEKGSPPLEKIKMTGSSSNGDLVETVDVFSDSSVGDSSAAAGRAQSKGKREYKAAPNVMPLSSGKVSSEQVKNEIVLFRKAQSLFDKKDYDNALRIFQTLENSPLAQVRVRAKFNIGNILLIQNEYDLALQVFEEIIHHYAFSGVVIPTLRNIIICADKLKLESKKVKYQSVLVDIFEQG